MEGPSSSEVFEVGSMVGGCVDMVLSLVGAIGRFREDLRLRRQ